MFNDSQSSHNESFHNKEVGGNGNQQGHNGIVVFTIDFKHVETPFIVCCWILFASVAKIVFHHFQWLSDFIPESCLLILLGVPVGFVLIAAGVSGHILLTAELFFQYLLPPIILDAGYFLTPQTFYYNIGTILLYAVIGTIFNTFAVGSAMYGVSGLCNVNITLLDSLVFGSLISAVDPVAVLAVFEEVHVNEMIYMLVFGESILNDAASVVLYRTFKHLPADHVDAKQIGLAIASFFVVSIFGAFVGIIYALLTSFITKYTQHVRVIEPIFVFIMSYMAYLTAETFHFSGIVSILFCSVAMKRYVESNVSRKSHITIKYFLKLLSSSCEAVIFMFLGVALVQYYHEFNIKFIAFTILFISIFRAVGISGLTSLANTFGRLEKVNKVEQFIMSYGGLRGAVAFCLAIVMEDGSTATSKLLKQTLVTTTISVVIFTCFIQGCTIKKMVDILGVRKSHKREVTMIEHLNDKVMSHMVAGVEEIIGVYGHGFWRNMMQHFNRRYLRHWLERNPEMALDDHLCSEGRRMAYKTALENAGYYEDGATKGKDYVEMNGVEDSTSSDTSQSSPSIISLANTGFNTDVSPASGFANSGKPHIAAFLLDPSKIAFFIPHASQSNKRRKYGDELTDHDISHRYKDKYFATGNKSLEAKKGNHHHSNKHHQDNHHNHHGNHNAKLQYHSRKPEAETITEVAETDDREYGIEAEGERNENEDKLVQGDMTSHTSIIET